MDILISGAGIAGPALAYWFHRSGHTVTVVERAPAPRRGGQTVDLRGEARSVITRMGLMEQVLERCVVQRGLAVLGRGDRIAATLSVDEFGGEGVVSEIEILRGDLADVLHTASLPGTEYLFDDTVTALDQHDSHVTVTCENAPARRFDLVVGADGPHSAVRRLAFGPEAGYTRPLGAYEAWFTAPADETLDGWYQMHRSPGGLVAGLRPGRLPGETKATLAFRSAPLDIDRRDVDGQRALVEERFAGIGWKVPWMLDAMRVAPDFTFDSFLQVTMDRWANGRVVLLGDAGYCPSPLSGLGTSLALVGAYVLAGELASAEPTTAFERYEQIMRPYVTEAQQLPPGGVNGYAPTSRFMIGLSVYSMRAMTRWPLRPLIAKQFAKASGIVLPDYGVRVGAGPAGVGSAGAGSAGV